MLVSSRVILTSQEWLRKKQWCRKWKPTTEGMTREYSKTRSRNGNSIYRRHRSWSKHQLQCFQLPQRSYTYPQTGGRQPLHGRRTEQLSTTFQRSHFPANSHNLPNFGSSLKPYWNPQILTCSLAYQTNLPHAREHLEINDPSVRSPKPVLNLKVEGW